MAHKTKSKRLEKNQKNKRKKKKIKPPEWQVYIVLCADGSLYTGIARDVARRLAEHNGSNGAGASYTRSRRPVALVYREAAKDRSAASKREYAIKQLDRAAKLELIAAAGGARAVNRA